MDVSLFNVGTSGTGSVLNLRGYKGKQPIGLNKQMLERLLYYFSCFFIPVLIVDWTWGRRSDPRTESGSSVSCAAG